MRAFECQEQLLILKNMDERQAGTAMNKTVQKPLFKLKLKLVEMNAHHLKSIPGLQII